MGCPGEEGRAGLPTRLWLPGSPDARPSLERPLSPARRSGGTRPNPGRAGGQRSSYLDQLLGGQPRARRGRRRGLRGRRVRGLRLRVVVRVLQLLAREERRVAGRVRGAQHGLELREHGLVLRGRWLRHGSQAGAQGEHPRSHGHSGGGAAAAPVAGRGSSALPTSRTLARAGELRAGPRAEEGRLRADPSAYGRHGFRRRARKAKLFRSATRKRQRPPGGHFLPPRPAALSPSPEPAPATAGRRERASCERAYLPRDYWHLTPASILPNSRWAWPASQTGSAKANPEAPRPAGPERLAYEQEEALPEPRLRRADRTPLEPRASRSGRPRSLYTSSLTEWAGGAGGGGKGSRRWNLGREGIRVETWREIS